jgi:hypothetical protein
MLLDFNRYKLRVRNITVAGGNQILEFTDALSVCISHGSADKFAGV